MLSGQWQNPRFLFTFLSFTFNTTIIVVVVVVVVVVVAPTHSLFPHALEFNNQHSHTLSRNIISNNNENASPKIRWCPPDRRPGASSRSPSHPAAADPSRDDLRPGLGRRSSFSCRCPRYGFFARAWAVWADGYHCRVRHFFLLFFFLALFSCRLVPPSYLPKERYLCFLRTRGRTGLSYRGVAWRGLGYHTLGTHLRWYSKVGRTTSGWRWWRSAFSQLADGILES